MTSEINQCKQKFVTSITTSVGDRLLKSVKHPEIIMLMEAAAFHKTTPTPQTFTLIAVIAGDIVYGLGVLCAVVIPGNTCFSMHGIREQQGPVPSQGLGTHGDPHETGQAEASPAKVHSTAFSEGVGRMGGSQAQPPAQGIGQPHGDGEGLRPGWAVCMLAWVRNRLGEGNQGQIQPCDCQAHV